MIMASLCQPRPGVIRAVAERSGGVRSHAPVAREGTRAGSVDDDEPDGEDDSADGGGDPEDTPEGTCPLVVPSGATDEDPGVVETAQDREGPEEEGEEGEEGDEDPKGDAPREVVSLRAEPQTGDRDGAPAEQAEEGD